MKRSLVLLFISSSIIAISTGFSSGALKTGQMSDELSSIIDVASVSFGLAVQPVDPNPKIVGDEFLDNIIKECKFHSDQSINTKTCVVCKLNDANGKPVAQGKVDLPGGYTASQTLKVQITDTTSPASNGVKNIHSVRLEVCDFRQGCSPGFWKNHLQLWVPETGFHPTDKFSTIFGLPGNSVKIKVDNKIVTDPTLNQAIRAQGGQVGGQGQLVRQGTAALLNAASNTVNYPLTVEEVIADVQEAFATKQFLTIKDILEQANDLVCPHCNGDSDDNHNGEHNDDNGGKHNDDNGGEHNDDNGGKHEDDNCGEQEDDNGGKHDGGNGKDKKGKGK